jgi:hypothetical protein
MPAPRTDIPPGIKDHALQLWVQHGHGPSLAWLWERGYRLSDNQWNFHIYRRDKTRFPRSVAPTPYRWTMDDILYLNKHWGSATREELVVRLGRSYSSIQVKARKLGLVRREFEFQAVDRRTDQPMLLEPERVEYPFHMRACDLVKSWGGHGALVVGESFTVNSQWYLVPTTTTDWSKALERLRSYLRKAAMNVALFNPELPYLTAKFGRHYGCLVPHALILVPGPDGVVRGWNLEPTSDLEALARVYGPAVRLPRKRSILLPKPGPGRPRKDRVLV